MGAFSTKNKERIHYRARQTNSRFEANCQHLLLRVSVDAKPFVGAHFEAITKWLQNRKTSIDQTILIADTLIRHNFISLQGMNDRDALEAARLAGQNWYKQHSEYIRAIRSNGRTLHIDFWNEWLKHSDYDQISSQYHSLYDKDELFKREVLRDAERFVNRRRELGEKHNWDLVYQLSTEFIMEELAVHKLVHNIRGGYHAYPSNQLHSEAYLANPTSEIPLELKYLNYKFVRLKVERGGSKEIS